MSTLRASVRVTRLNALNGRHELITLPPGPIHEPYISLIITRYPANWQTLLDLNDTDPPPPGPGA